LIASIISEGTSRDSESRGKEEFVVRAPTAYGFDVSSGVDLVDGGSTFGTAQPQKPQNASLSGKLFPH
jgi:hypothetical protein